MHNIDAMLHRLQNDVGCETGVAVSMNLQRQFAENLLQGWY